MRRYGGAVTVVLVTGMSGTGKSAGLAELARRGHRVVDTDDGGYSEEVPCSDPGGWEQLWRKDRIEALLDGHDDGVLFIAGCVSAAPGRATADILHSGREIVRCVPETNGGGSQVIGRPHRTRVDHALSAARCATGSR